MASDKGAAKKVDDEAVSQEEDDQDAQILIVDSDTKYLDNLKKDQAISSVSPYCANSLELARKNIEDQEIPILAVFISTSIGSGVDWISVVEQAHKNRPGVPIYLVEQERTGLTKEELKGLGVRRSLGRKLDFQKMVDIVGPFSQGFDIDGALEKAKSNKDSVGGVSTYTSEEFVPLRAENFLSGSKSLFDVYVKLSDIKFVKILQAGDEFDLDRLENYMRKGLTHFYIKKEIQSTYLEYCEHLTNRILTSDKAPVELKVAQTLNVGQEAMNYFKENGVTKKGMKHAEGYVGNVRTLFKQFNPKKHGLLAEFMNDLATYEHGVAATSIASLVTKHLGLNSHQAENIVGVGALMHDIGMLEMPENVKTEDESLMSPHEIKLYHEHPHLGAEAVSKIPGVPPAVSQAIAQHHVRRNKMGFPSDMVSANRTIVSEVIGLSDEFARAIAKEKKMKEQGVINFNAYKYLQENVFQGFTRPVVEAFTTEFAQAT